MQNRNLSTSLPTNISQEIKDGKALIGDQFDLDQLKVWFSQEQEAFYEGDAGNSDVDPWYAYMRYVNEVLGFSLISDLKRKKGSLLILGPGSGKEVEFFVDQNPGWTITFIESSDNFKNELKRNFSTSIIVDPKISGDIDLNNVSQDVICAFSVLHHIPNVTHVIEEISRVSRPGAIFVVREPCSSMGDWRYPRSATPNERGISRDYLIATAQKAGFELAKKPTPIIFEPINKILKYTVGYSCVSFRVLYLFDRLVSKILSFNDHYWRDSWYKKFGPSSYFYVFRKL